MLRTRKANRSTLYCFSPPVMIATFVIELSLAAYTLWRYKMNRITRMATVLFVALATLSTGWWYSRRNPHKKVRRAVSGLMLGYSIFIVPATSVNLMNSATVSGMPSIMCGFAVLLALMLAWMVLPVTAERK